MELFAASAVTWLGLLAILLVSRAATPPEERPARAAALRRSLRPFQVAAGLLVAVALAGLVLLALRFMELAFSVWR